MSLLSLRDIGKIYVSENSVAVGIRGVNLDFDRGEFVAVTGKSGSGKSTLLNVISGMDSYEEGELFIEGRPTSHYIQADWELYRENYISFIFQDYNIIDSFTVLQNVELALMNIEDRKERRARALELIDRVGLTKWLHQKGSKLSGGQKQRTVIARALAKDSPIILADEPTGNLDSETAKDIIALLDEVSKDKLLIVVTHNFDQVEDYATRHVRIFDGAVESDRIIRESRPVSEEAAPKAPEKKSFLKTLKDGITLGLALFSAKPLLSFFLCLFMTLGALGIFAVTSLCSFGELFEKRTLFEPMEGRVVVASQNPAELSDEKLKALAEKTGAADFLHYDYLLDKSSTVSNCRLYFTDGGTTQSLSGTYLFLTDDKPDFTPSIGHYPMHPGEILLYLPIGERDNFGTDSIRNSCAHIGTSDSKSNFIVTGIYYTLDNTEPNRIYFSRDGFMAYSQLFANGNDAQYGQASLFYPSFRAARKALPALKDAGYIAVSSSETYTPPVLETILSSLALFGLLVVWLATVVFLAFFINLCMGRSMASLQGDLAILRSMGIPVKTIRLSIYVRMFIAMLIATVIMLLTAVIIFRTPTLNQRFSYLPLWSYLVILIGMVILTLRITARQIKRLFGESVKKTLKGGDSK